MTLLVNLLSTYQQEILLAFASCIQYAHYLGPNKWGTYQVKPDHLRLLMGSLIVTMVEHGALWVNLPVLDEAETSFFNSLRNWAWEPRWRYKAVPSMSGYYWPMRDHARIWPRIQRHHFIYLGLVAKKYDHLRKPSQDTHSDELLVALETATGKNICRPIYSSI